MIFYQYIPVFQKNQYNNISLKWMTMQKKNGILNVIGYMPNFIWQEEFLWKKKH